MSELSQPEAAERLRALLARPAYWTATAMQQQGSQFFQHLGAALLAADRENRRRVYESWPAECWDFHLRGLRLEAAESEGTKNGSAGKNADGTGARLPGMTPPEDNTPENATPENASGSTSENQMINTSGTPEPKPAASPDAPESVLVSAEKDPRTAGPVSPFGYRDDYPPTLLAVFAHPDDEAFSVGGTLAHYARKGVRVVLACATRGEAGKITDPSMTVTDLGKQREEELKAACRALGIPDPVFLDYHDSGREERTRYDDPKALMNVPVFELEQKIRELIEEVQPQVIVTFDPHGGYGHIDHLQVNRATTAAFFSTGHLPKPPQRLYFTALTAQAAERITAFNGLDPLLYGVAENTAVVRMNVWPYRELKKAALAAHGTQMGPQSRMGQLSEAERAQMENTLLGRENFSLGGTRASVPRWPLEGLFDGVNFVMYIED